MSRFRNISVFSRIRTFEHAEIPKFKFTAIFDTYRLTIFGMEIAV